VSGKLGVVDICRFSDTGPNDEAMAVRLTPCSTLIGARRLRRNRRK
jgi:hypothetical protein